MCLAETGVGCRWLQSVQLPQPRRFPQIPSLCPYLPSLYLSVDVGPRRPCTTNSCTQFSESDFRVDCENWNKHCMPCVDVDSVTVPSSNTSSEGRGHSVSRRICFTGRAVRCQLCPVHQLHIAFCHFGNDSKTHSIVTYKDTLINVVNFSFLHAVNTANVRCSLVLYRVK